ncbi:MAG: hypothetical protein KJ042_04870 [Deltaproteobacteria bacterium]|nr:hypothetical protein [Deltaproteobacteria bacterium]
MTRRYQKGTTSGSGKLAEHLSKDEPLLMPMLELVLESKAALDELPDDAGRAMVEPVWMSMSTASRVFGA